MSVRLALVATVSAMRQGQIRGGLEGQIGYQDLEDMEMA